MAKSSRRPQPSLPTTSNGRANFALLISFFSLLIAGWSANTTFQNSEDNRRSLILQEKRVVRQSLLEYQDRNKADYTGLKLAAFQIEKLPSGLGYTLNGTLPDGKFKQGMQVIMAELFKDNESVDATIGSALNDLNTLDTISSNLGKTLAKLQTNQEILDNNSVKVKHIESELSKTRASLEDFNDVAGKPNAETEKK